MKFSAGLALAGASLTLAKSINHVYPSRLQARAPKNDKSPGGIHSGIHGSKDGPTHFFATGDSSEVIIIWADQGGGGKKMYMNPQATVTQTVTQTVNGNAAATGPAMSKTHMVTVGGVAGLVYTPESIQAAVGDMVIFSFMSANHTVTQSSFATPCETMTGGMDSSFVPNVNNTIMPPPQVAIQVMVDTPLWFYCKQKGHCGKGMVFSINPTAEKSPYKFQSMAIAQNGTGNGTGITGGSGSATTTTAAANRGTGGGSTRNATSGTGTIVNGACQCAVVCAAGSLSNAAVQGLGAFGGAGGSMPAAMAIVVV